MPMRSLDPYGLRAPSSTRAASRPRATTLRVAAWLIAATALGGCSVSYPLFGAEDEIKTGSISRGQQADGAGVTPVGPSDKVTAAPLPPPPGSNQPSAATAAAAAAAPSAYAPPGAASVAAGDRGGLSPSDWTYARGALGLAMGAEATNASVPWANPDNGAYGSFTAAAAATSENGATCRAFAGSHSAAGHVQRLEGTACRTAAGHWEAVAVRTTASRSL